MAANPHVASTSLKTLFLLLSCAMLATLIYTVYIDGLPFRQHLLTPWMTATVVDLYINIAAIAAWIYYKESNFISGVVWIILLVCFGSFITCAYIFLQFMKLSSEESSQDAMYYVLLRHVNKDGMQQKLKHSPVVIARIVFIVLGCLMFATLLYTLITDGSPFRKDLLYPWMTATLIDFYIHVVVLSVWVAYKESSWVDAFFWIVLLICFGSITTCAYIAKQLFQLSTLDPLYLVLLNRGNRAESRYERT